MRQRTMRGILWEGRSVAEWDGRYEWKMKNGKPGGGVINARYVLRDGYSVYH